MVNELNQNATEKYDEVLIELKVINELNQKITQKYDELVMEMKTVSELNQVVNYNVLWNVR